MYVTNKQLSKITVNTFRTYQLIILHFYQLKCIKQKYEKDWVADKKSMLLMQLIGIF